MTTTTKTTSDTAERLYSTSETASILGICTETLRKLMRTGIIGYRIPAGPNVKNARKFFTQADIAAYQQRGTVVAPKAIS